MTSWITVDGFLTFSYDLPTGSGQLGKQDDNGSKLFRQVRYPFWQEQL